MGGGNASNLLFLCTRHVFVVCYYHFSYANRAKNIQNNARINEDPKDAMLREFQKEINELKLLLEEGIWGALVVESKYRQMCANLQLVAVKVVGMKPR